MPSFVILYRMYFVFRWYLLSIQILCFAGILLSIQILILLYCYFQYVYI